MLSDGLFCLDSETQLQQCDSLGFRLLPTQISDKIAIFEICLDVLNDDVITYVVVTLHRRYELLKSGQYSISYSSCYDILYLI